MPKIFSAIDPKDVAFQDNRADMLAQIHGLRQLEGMIRARSEKSRERFIARNQLLPRDRLQLLLDRGAPWLELSTTAGYKTYDDDGGENISGTRLITGIGMVAGVRCVVIVDDSGILAGAIHTHGVDKMVRAFNIALENKLPTIHLVQSAGADLLDYVPATWVRAGGMFHMQAKLSAAGCPVISVVHGASTAGGAYMPGMSDYVVMVRKQAMAFLAGPPLLKAATGEIADAESLGGTDMHARISGLTEYVAEDDPDALRICRDIVTHLNWPGRLSPAAARTWEEPAYDIDELCGIVPVEYQKPYDIHEVIARLVDGSDFLEFKTEYDQQTICGHASIMGHPCGMIGSNGPITPNGATKATQFMQLCDQSDTPLIYLHNTTGFIVGTEAEEDGMIKHGAKMIQAVSNVSVPRITLMIGASFGAGAYAMSGWSYEPRFLLAWPSMQAGVMGGKQAGLVMRIVHEAKSKRQGVPLDEAELDALEAKVVELYDSMASGLYYTARMWTDGMIDPRDSRNALGLLLATCDEEARRSVNPNSFGVARP
ncbi:MAG: carboxyl transferase domain-containing protein [Alphaproteobacteria bacterium]|jgi:geranyl-CoA carboxylase beta subunit|nr:carboxyl transferase domain-containing protein [Alphaproteobacteria bacterium]MDP6253971.1 carboxyl transferase domain-containing protein [Alphaproteobacteria bacterium]MDP7056223.1 carboxyl transferase domain-containing protein [Alphaproteobacteria bacterium]MDP7227568.1 carboxyl transferase domain-containing protein [Alphaproteobacteria bacterium]MDP7460385.1 carboxyl transferase domain-containing protein [Alphaproteobacteria bacterium]|tara:strand:+ start:17 stop:1639 length:1623 start_codon:yes stop_codon:yes gene_type:complete